MNGPGKKTEGGVAHVGEVGVAEDEQRVRVGGQGLRRRVHCAPQGEGAHHRQISNVHGFDARVEGRGVRVGLARPDAPGVAGRRAAEGAVQAPHVVVVGEVPVRRVTS